MEVTKILDAVYEIQGAADAAHPQTLESLQARMKDIYDLACDVMRKTGYQPED